MKKITLVTAVFILFTVLLSACGSPEIRVENAWVRPDPLMESAAGYLVIYNDGDGADALIGVKAEFVNMASVHQTVMEGAVHKMLPVPSLEIPPGGQVTLQPMSYHLMLMGLVEPVEIGQKVTLTLTFEKTGDVVVEAEVRQE